MPIKKLYKDIFERVNFLDKELGNPFLMRSNKTNPFSKFFGGTYVWIDMPENDSTTSNTEQED